MSNWKSKKKQKPWFISMPKNYDYLENAMRPKRWSLIEIKSYTKVQSQSDEYNMWES